MAQDDRKCSSGSGGAGGSDGVSGSAASAGRSSKKQKQKKTPQRGLGVAQLERMRLEEQQKRNASSMYPSPPTFNSFCLPASLPNYRVQSEFCPSGTLLRHIPSAPSIEIANASPVPSQTVSSFCEYDAEMRNSIAEHDLELRSKLSLPLESSLVWGGHGLMQRVGSDYPPLLVNASSATSTSLQSFPMEPPSNQIHLHGNFAPFKPKGEKMLGGVAKRSCPFSLENPPAPYFPFKLPKVGNPISGLEETSLSGIDNHRDGHSGSSSMLESSSTESAKESKISGGEFLTLAPPLGTSPWKNWNFSQHFASSASRNCPYPNLEFPPFQGCQEGLGYRHAPSWTDQQQQPFQPPYYSFLPPIIMPNVENAHGDACSSEPPGSIDLNLKL